jgi:mono/diheme cytochrome c family protein
MFAFLKAMRMSKRHSLLYIAICLLIVLVGCGNNMRDQARCQPLEANTFFDDGKCARQIPPDTVARGYVQDGAELASAGADGQPAGDYPFPITAEVLAVGRERYDIFCAPCHGLAGYGSGMIVQRGFPAPPSFHTPRLREVPPGYIYDVITNGIGRMYSYAYRVPPEQRWAIVAYVQALQLSQNATLEDVPPEERQRLQGAVR